MSKTSHDDKKQEEERKKAAAAGKVAFKAAKAGGGNSSIRYAHRAINPMYGGPRISNWPDGANSQEDVLIALDTTGSNKDNAEDVYEDLPGFMHLANRTGWFENLAMAFGTVNDLTCDGDNVTNTISQMERAGDVLDKWLSLTPLPGGGGGQKTESYELMFWLAVNMFQLEAWKHGRKGKMFIIFDEKPYPKISAHLLQQMFLNREVPEPDKSAGDVEISVNQNRLSTDTGLVLPSSDIDTFQFVQNELLPKWDVYPIICGSSGYYNDAEVLKVWKKMFGEQAIIKVQDPSDISEAILAVLALQAGNDAIDIAAELGKTLAGGISAEDFVAGYLPVASAYGEITPNVKDTGLVPRSVPGSSLSPSNTGKTGSKRLN